MLWIAQVYIDKIECTWSGSISWFLAVSWSADGDVLASSTQGQSMCRLLYLPTGTSSDRRSHSPQTRAPTVTILRGVWRPAWEAQSKRQGRTWCVPQLESWVWWTGGDQCRPSMPNTTGRNGFCFALRNCHSEGRQWSHPVQNTQRSSVGRTQQRPTPSKWDGPHQSGSSPA